MRALLLSSCAIALLAICWMVLLRNLPQPNESRWIEQIFQRKEAVAAEIKGPKVVLIGGSATHYSYSAKVLSDLTGLKVVNLGSHAGLGGPYILYRARRSLKPGDTAILALEHQVLASVKPTSMLAQFVMTTNPDYLLKAPPLDVPAIYFGYVPADVLRQLPSSLIPRNSPVMRAESVTDEGDESANTPANKLPYMLNVVRASGPIGVSIDPSHPPVYLIEFVEWAHQNNVNVIAAWPPTIDQPAYAGPASVAYFDQFAATYRSVGVPVLGTQLSYLIPENDMFDSMYHADVNGRASVSKVLALDLCRMVRCPRSDALEIGP